MYCLTPNLSHVFQELLSVYLFVLGNIEFVLTMLGLCCSLEVARTSGLQSPISQEMWVQSLSWEDPLEKEMATHSSILACKIPQTEVPGGLQSMGLQSWALLSD